ncbi:hypothetical protein GCM10022216_14560 [Sphingobacterium kyonggiense]|uniref:Uncharacterized protein n=1 Tax=Sphingobacterium kyonggiense TaxID=714075 RepID=A0ABP7YL69_9SPHI
MGLLKKLGKVKIQPLTIGKVLNPFVLIDKLKQNKLLETTSFGIFYTYLEFLKVNENPENLLKQLYIYGRSTKLLKEGEVLQIKEKDNGELIASILADDVQIFYKKDKSQV